MFVQSFLDNGLSQTFRYTLVDGAKDKILYNQPLLMQEQMLILKCYLKKDIM